MGPLAVLILSASLLILAGRRLPDHWRTILPSWLIGVTLLLWIVLRFQPAHPMSLWVWQAPLGLSTAFGFTLDGWAWLAGLGMILLAFTAVALPGWHSRPGFVDSRHWSLLALAFALVVILADTWISLLAVWAALMLFLGLAAGGVTSRPAKAGGVGILSALFLVMASLLNGLDSLGAVLSGQTLNAQAQLLIVLAAALHIGVYPFHLWLVPEQRRSPGRHLILHLLAGLAALHLLGRFDLPLLASQAWVPLGIVALLGSALAAWADPDSERAWVYVLINRGVWAVLIVGLTRLPLPLGAIFPLAVLALGGMLWGIARVAPFRSRWSPPHLLAAAVFMGLPLTPAFAPNLMLGQLAGSLIGLPGWILALLAQTLLVAAMFRQPRAQTSEADAASPGVPRGVTIALILAALLTVWWGVFPAGLANLTGQALAGVLVNPLAQIRNAGWLGWVTILLPLLLGLPLALLDERLFGHLRGWQTNLATVAGLDWLYGGLERILRLVITALGALSDLLDGAGQFGWVLLAALVAWILFGG